MEDEIIQIKGHHYIRVTSSPPDERTRVLKHDDTFGVFDRFGDVRMTGRGDLGLFHCGTRYLSQFELRLMDQVRPLLLSSTVNEANEVLTVDLTNPDVTDADGVELLVPRGGLHILRLRFIWQGTCYERLQLVNYGLRSLPVTLTLRFAADYRDVFEVRGAKRANRGTRLPSRVDPDGCELGYRGLDGQVRRTIIRCSPRPAVMSHGVARFEVTTHAKHTTVIEVAISCESEEARKPPSLAFDAALAASSEKVRASARRQAQVQTDNEQAEGWLRRSVADLHMMTTEMTTGPYPYAGVPWFSTVFGRDGIITAFQLLWLDPAIARGVLAYLATNQATIDDGGQEAEPGKILHETRRGEMAKLREIPFGRYYGSVDSTPLFIMLAEAYFRRTGDESFLQFLWPNIERAIAWMDDYGDRDRDGFIEYAARGADGLVQQGWKDSADSVFHADGTIAAPPIALCEVQGYVYAARRAAASLARAQGLHEYAAAQSEKARALQEAFEAAFWCDDLGTYALALDGAKQPCRVRSSNAGQCLWTGIVFSPERATRVTQTLLSPGGSSGWGIRTLHTSEIRYNPMSYHNGSIWPHDNALVAAGFRRYGLSDATLVPFSAMLAATRFLDLQRLPELFCGFPRRSGEGPTLYPVACLPQAWASGSVFMMLQACLGLDIFAREHQLRFENPVLPREIGQLTLRNIQVGAATIDLLLERHAHDVGVTVLGRTGEVDVVVTK